MSKVKARTGSAVCAAVAAAAALAACTSGSRPVGPTPTPSPSTEARGVIAGFVDLCTGPAATPPRAARVRVMTDGTTIASTRVIAGDPAHRRYRLLVRPGRYLVEATNWPHVQHVVKVKEGSRVTANFPNVCD